jgi:hypothetical protein
VRSHYKGGLKIAFLLLRRAVSHAQSQSVLAFVAIKPVCSFDACSAQHNYGGMLGGVGGRGLRGAGLFTLK